ncbi:MAG: flavodoxin [Bacteroidetes bacterium HGW-Bacteroidetes-22]|nr:MAG: flavodoxin [Bacteroidetes bacterium HGW-Bacteroidetes-22]
MVTLQNQSTAPNTPGDIKMLIVYFSHSGNTREIANQIKNLTGADIFEIQPIDAYPESYNAVVAQAKKEISGNFKPKLKSMAGNIEIYEIIFIGSPNWWSTIAPPVATFLSVNKLEGKTIIPFITHEGSRMGRSASDIKKYCPGSTILEGLPIRESNAKGALRDIASWLQCLGFNKR